MAETFAAKVHMYPGGGQGNRVDLSCPECGAATETVVLLWHGKACRIVLTCSSSRAHIYVEVGCVNAGPASADPARGEGAGTP